MEIIRGSFLHVWSVRVLGLIPYNPTFCAYRSTPLYLRGYKPRRILGSYATITQGRDDILAIQLSCSVRNYEIGPHECADVSGEHSSSPTVAEVWSPLRARVLSIHARSAAQCKFAGLCANFSSHLHSGDCELEVRQNPTRARVAGGKEKGTLCSDSARVGRRRRD